MSGTIPRRPTEVAAIAAAARSARPLPPVESLLSAQRLCQMRGDRAGARLAAARSARALGLEVVE
ncbi:hypothetical protein [Streptomyces sp. NRRL F-5630]|uniref:hypothetical protein n=1 Tax=Streptomyces sp. NRRL F-5630 TaxID=1463864 RepID=UPI003EBE2C0E